MATKLVPLGDRVIVKPIKEEEITSFGLVLPETGKEKPMEGEIISISKTLKDCDLKVGDNVIFREYSPTKFKVNKDEELYVLSAEDVLAKIQS